MPARPASANCSQLVWTRVAASWVRPAFSQLLDGFGDVAVRGEPVTGPGTQDVDDVGARELELAESDGAEEVVEAEPASLRVEGHGTGWRAPTVAGPGTVRPFEDVVAELRGELVEHRDAEDEVA